MNKLHEWINTAGILAVAILLLVGGNQSANTGASGTRFPNGISANNTSPVAGEVVATTFTAVATTTSASQGIPAYYTLGGVDYADVEVALTATSSIPGIIRNPWGTTASSTLVACGVNITSNGMAQAQLGYISTTSESVYGYGSSTAAISAVAVAASAQVFAPCSLNSATTTTANAQAPYGVPAYILPGRTDDGVSAYTVDPGHSLTFRNATRTAGTYASYWTGTFWARFAKP